MKQKMIILILVVFSTGCTKDSWTGFLYPDKSDLTKSIEVGSFPSLESCRDSIRSHTKYTENSDYECGLNCKPSDYGINICKKTMK